MGFVTASPAFLSSVLGLRNCACPKVRYQLTSLVVAQIVRQLQSVGKLICGIHGMLVIVRHELASGQAPAFDGHMKRAALARAFPGIEYGRGLRLHVELAALAPL